MATQTRRPTGEGPTEWTPSAGNNWECVSDESDSTYVSATDTTATDVYTHADFDFTGTVNKLTNFMRIKDTGTNCSFYNGRMIINGSYYYGAVRYGGASFADETYDWLTNPDSSSAWTKDELNGIGTHGVDTYSARAAIGADRTGYISDFGWIVDYEEEATGATQKSAIFGMNF